MRSRVEDDSRYGLVITIEMVGQDIVIATCWSRGPIMPPSTRSGQKVFINTCWSRGHAQLPSRWSNKVDINRNTLVSMASHEQPHRESTSRHGLAATLEMIE